MDGDFIKTLSKEERIVFARALLFLIQIDQNIDSRERAYMHEISNVYGVQNDFAELTKPMSREIIFNEIRTIQDKRKALFLMKELLSAANVDDDFADEEAEFIERAAALLNIPEQKVLDINHLILDRKLWMHCLRQLVEE